MINSAELLAVYDDQVRKSETTTLPPGVHAEPDGPIVRLVGSHTGFISAPVDLGISGGDLATFVRRQRDFFAARGEAVEWKTRSHDRPPEIFDHLRAAEFVPQAPETVMVGRVKDLVAMSEPRLDIVAVRRTANPVDAVRIAELECEVWGEDLSWMAEDLAGRMSLGTDAIAVFVAEAEAIVVAAAWLVAKPQTDFAGLWGGSTLAPWRRRGIYRALLHERAKVADEWGVSFVQVDASDASRPILERLGLIAITTSTPYVWRPAVEVVP